MTDAPWMTGPTCDVCGALASPSHYHCPHCKDPKPTSMLGHYRSGHMILGIWISCEGHICCDPEECEYL